MSELSPRHPTVSLEQTQDLAVGGFQDRRPIFVLLVVVLGHEWLLPVPGSAQWDLST